MSSFKLSLRNYRGTGIMMGCVLAGLLLFQVIILAITYFANKDMVIQNPDSITITISGIDLLIAVFIFAMACGNFKSNFNMQIQNSVSRKTQFVNLLLSGVVFCGGAAIVHTVIYGIANPAFNSFYLNNFTFADASAGLNYEMFGSYYHSLFFAPNNLTFTNLVWTFLLMFANCVFAYVFGCLCSNISYRLPNDLARFAVFLTPILLIGLVFPIIDAACFDGVVTLSVIDFLDFINGYTTDEPWINICSNFVTSAILSVVFFFVLKTTPVKKA